MKTLNVRNMRKARQAGFTIIELVVVILLLGILTATALPRFMDVTDEAHAAIVDGVQGSLLTGAALFRAQWIAEGEVLGAAPGYGAGTLFPDATSTGYPTDVTDGILDDETECTAIYNGLLQTGRPVAAAATFSTTASTLETAIEAAASATTDFVITADAATTPTGCILHYVGQFKSGNTTVPNTVPTLTYLTADGSVTAGTYTMNLAP